MIRLLFVALVPLIANYQQESLIVVAGYQFHPISKAPSQLQPVASTVFTRQEERKGRRNVLSQITRTAAAAALTIGSVGLGLPSGASADDNTSSSSFIDDPRGYSYKVITPGTGQGPTSRGQPVKISYTISLDGFVDGSGSSERVGKTAESSIGVLGDKPVAFPVGVGQVIKGWDYSARDMKVGERRLAIIPPSLGYGKTNTMNGQIPTGSTLYLDIKLLEVGKVPQLTEVQQKWLDDNSE